MNLDMYESDDGEEIFTGGRAYGGSRIAVMSTFRDKLFVGDIHRWPSSHGEAYVSAMCGRSIINTKTSASATQLGPVKKAINAASRFSRAHQDDRVIGFVEWLSRVAQMITHELGHCFGLDHCVYFACAMQGCASTAGALWQPPCLCPVCLEKLIDAIGDNIVDGRSSARGQPQAIRQRRTFVRWRYQAIKSVCDCWMQVKPSSPTFIGYSAWIESVRELAE